MFQTYGAIQIINIPNFREAREKALKPLSNCLINDDSLTSKTMKDGSRRVSSAAITKDGTTGRISNSCSDLASSSLRYTIDMVTQNVFKALDVALMTNDRNKNSYVMYPYKSVSSLMSNGIQLEHLHSYFPAAKNASSNSLRKSGNTLDMHVDAGIMIAMTTGYYSSDNDNNNNNNNNRNNNNNEDTSHREDLFIELPTGEVVIAKTDEDAVILLGDNNNSSCYNNNNNNNNNNISSSNK
jgi:hypothetical protein